MPRDTGKKNQDIVLSGGLVVDGTGGEPSTASILIRGGRIHRIARGPLRTQGVVIDCAGRAVTPGFIDVHSHLDWHLPIKGHDELKYPFLAQGITTVVGGNCGSSAAGFRSQTTFRAKLADNIFQTGLLSPQWDSVSELFEQLASSGISHNLALLAGHGTTRASIRGYNPSPLHPYETKELLWLLQSAMEQGARGVSLGLQYEPGIFARTDELREVAALVRKKGGILAVHTRAFSALAPGSKIRLFGEPHNLIALRELLDLARSTGVRLQLSHLIFVGTRTWRSADAALGLIDQAIAQGVDVRFDTSPFHCSASLIGVVLPPWFVARGASAYEDPRALRKLRKELRLAERLLGFGAADIQVTDCRDPEREEQNGRFLPEIARLRRQNPIDALIDLARRSAGQARVLIHRSSNERIVETLIRHPASMFMTDAWVQPEGTQNPSAYGAFPRLLALCRDRGLQPLERIVHRMTGDAARRFGITDRGLLKEGLAADIVVFDHEQVRDNTSAGDATAAPTGIDYVFVNGSKIIGSGRRENPLTAGIPLA
jgi:N-acyl-D-amino-acid deacylase